MPDTRSHRGPHPEDAALFGPGELPALRAAVADLSWLRTRGYGSAATQMVGDRYGLVRRQRDAVARSACSDAERVLRRAAICGPADCAGQPLLIDGFNVLITLESALGGAFLFRGRDGCFRDVGGLRGTYRLVEETRPAIRLAGAGGAALGLGAARWMLDAHVSNTGRLRSALLEEADAHEWDWTVEVTDEIDAVLIRTPHIVATSDSTVLNQTEHWANLTKAALARAESAPKICALV